jgi:hypothetical protein
MNPVPRSADSQPGNDALQAQITALGENMQQGFSRIENTLLGLDQRLRNLENREAGCQPMVNSRLDATWRVIDELKADLVLLRKSIDDERGNSGKISTRVTQLETRLGLVVAIGSTVGVGMISWIVAQLMGAIR